MRAGGAQEGSGAELGRGDRASARAVGEVLIGAFLGVVLLLAAAASAAADEPGWELLKQGGHVALIRHAEAPGVGDPADFRLDDCSTQRNLSAEGRSQAVRIGQAFARRGVRISRVLTSRWCRCIETAQLAFGRYEPFPALDSLHGRRELAARQAAEVEALLAEAPRNSVLVLVTHQATIGALVGGASARSGEILVAPLRPDGVVEIAARLAPP